MRGAAGYARDRVGLTRAQHTAIVLAIVLGLLVAGVSGNAITKVAAASGSIIDTSSSVTVTATNSFSFTPNRIGDLPTSTTITVDFVNGDTNGGIHTFTILGCEGRTIPTTGPNAYDISEFINGSKCALAPLKNIAPPAYGSHTATFSAPTSAGWYEFICTTAGHLSLGMLGYIAFGEDVPANLTPPGGSPGAGTAVFIIVGTIVTLTVIAIVLGFVVGRREGAQHEMPPERLGYAEPGSGRPPTPPAAR